MEGRKSSVLSDTDKRAILREASNSHDSVSKIRAKAGVDASKTTVWRVISKAKHLKRLKLKKKPPLNPKRKEARLTFCRVNMSWCNEWKRVVFSDEKKFNLEGPDGYNYYYYYYFHDLRKETHQLERLHSRVGGVMVWGAISYYRTCELQFLSSNMNAKAYLNVLEKAFPPLENFFNHLPWTFQHDNAPIHTARVVKSFLKDKNVETLNWPPYSPDLNIIENVWGWLARKVYESGKQFSTKEELIDAIQRAWATISLDYIKSLYDSLPNMIYEVILNKGGSTHY